MSSAVHCWNMRSAGTDCLDPSVAPGALKRRTFPFETNDGTAIERSTNRERRSTLSFAEIEALRLHRSSFIWRSLKIVDRQGEFPTVWRGRTCTRTAIAGVTIAPIHVLDGARPV